VISQGLKFKVEHGAIYKVQAFSSHAPLIMDYDLEV
jgi:exodeoxyribonuclease-3